MRKKNPGPLDPDERFMSRLLHIRQAQGLTLTALAKKARLTVPAISHMETGRRLASPDAVKRLAKALGVKPEHLARGVKFERKGTVRTYRTRDKAAA